MDRKLQLSSSEEHTIFTVPKKIMKRQTFGIKKME
jgi:hypothetical protein